MNGSDTWRVSKNHTTRDHERTRAADYCALQRCLLHKLVVPVEAAACQDAADLVVLSACQTGLGKEIRGEGLVGLTRGFMYAGAPRVVSSLWKVDDAATAELMKRVYRGMLKDNLRPAAALRAAKMEMWKQKRWQAPFYWAAFELQGEWN